MFRKKISRRRRWLLGSILSLATLVATDQGLARFALAKATAQGWSLPPYGSILSADQEAWLNSISKDLDKRGNTIYRVDPKLGWDNAPLGKDRHGLSTTNSAGFRGKREYAVPKPESVIRIVCCGDSYTWGADVDDEGSFPAALERHGERLEAPNLGVSAYGSGQALLRFRRDGIELEPDVAILGVMVENIGRNVNRYRPLWATYCTVASVKPRFILENGRLVSVPSPFHGVEDLIASVRDGSVVERAKNHEYWRAHPGLHFLAWSPTARLVGGFVARRQRNVKALWMDSAGEPYRVTREIIEAFQREALAAGAERALVVFFPEHYALSQVARGQPAYWRGMLQEIERDGFEVVDVTGDLLEEHQRMTADGKRSAMYSPRNHLLAHYNEVVAQAVLEKLDLL